MTPELLLPFILLALGSLALFWIALVGAQHRKLSLPTRRLDEVNDDLQRQQHTLNQTKQELLGAQDTIREAQHLETKIDQYRETVQEYEARLAKLVTAKMELTQAQEDLAQLKEQANRTREALDQDEAMLKSITIDKNKAEARTRALEERRDALDKNLIQLKTNVAAAEANLQTTQSSLQTARTELADTRAKQESAQKLHAELSAQVAGLKVEASAQQKALESARYQHQTTIAKLEADMAERKRQLDAQLETERARITAELEALRKSAEADRTAIQQGLDAARADAKRRLEIIQNQLDRLTEIWKEMRADFAKNQQQSLDQWKEDQQALRELITRQWEMLESHIRNSVEAMNKQWSLLSPPDAKEENERLSALWEPVFTAKELSDRGPKRTEQQHLEKTKKYLRDLGLVYPERVVNAFHTCLKTNEMSLLTVLAGISGTGKSELPRRYAEGMGLHFLNVAVQPRWDSPQDLFGFYNYMEGSYRATELARVLVQLERFNAATFPKGVTRLPERMAIVLMDEMNLARVEYYFSEFLSKLEVRRGIDPSSAAGRRPAEITFEAGTLPAGTEPTRIFPFGNVLFVGTMNEDETTQSLSDKVVDRANVLRFGKPKNLADASASPEPPPRSRHALQFTEWNSWLRRAEDSLAAPEREQIQGWIRRVNDNALGKLRRPFGYRVSLAMEQYVANYPVGSKNRDDMIRAAFADQIEQRVMPKLRGIDCHDGTARAALEEIRSVVDEMEDAPLLDAFNQAAGSDLFLWHGVEREAQS